MGNWLPHLPVQEFQYSSRSVNLKPEDYRLTVWNCPMQTEDTKAPYVVPQSNHTQATSVQLLLASTPLEDGYKQVFALILFVKTICIQNPF